MHGVKILLCSSLFSFYQGMVRTMKMSFTERKIYRVVILKYWAVYKAGTGTRRRGHWDACVGTCDSGTRDEGLGDIKYGTRGRVGRGRGTSNTGTRGTRDVDDYCDNCDFSHFPREGSPPYPPYGSSMPVYEAKTRRNHCPGLPADGILEP